MTPFDQSRSQALDRIAQAGALVQTSTSVDEVAKWSEIEWDLREKFRPTWDERHGPAGIEQATIRYRQLYHQDWEARKKAARELQAKSKTS